MMNKHINFNADKNCLLSLIGWGASLSRPESGMSWELVKATESRISSLGPDMFLLFTLHIWLYYYYLIHINALTRRAVCDSHLNIEREKDYH